MIKNSVFKLGFRLGMHRLFMLPPWRKPVTVLCLHRVNPVNDTLFSRLHPDVFKGMIRLLKKDYRIMGFSELNTLDPSDKNRRPILVVSFDDGYKDFVDYAMPVIRSEGIPVNHNIVVQCAESGALIWTQRLNNLLSYLRKKQVPIEMEHEGFVFKPADAQNIIMVKKTLFDKLFKMPFDFINGFIDSMEKKYSFLQPANEMMNWSDVITCHNEGVEIGSHSYYHSSLESGKNDDLLQTETMISKSVIEGKIGEPVSTFAFPNGLVNRQAYDSAIKAGYTTLLLIDGIDYSHVIRPAGTIHHYKRTLVGGHTTPYENVFNVVGFHKAFHI